MIVNKVLKKLNSRAGESLPEVLIAVLIVAMGMVLLGTLLNVSSRMVEKGQAKVEAVYEDVSDMDMNVINNGNGVSRKTGQVEIKYGNENMIDSKYVTVEIYEGDNLISYGPEGNNNED